jgi:hypothetical protein
MTACGSPTVPPLVINNYCDIHKPIITTRYDTCSTLLQSDIDVCRYSRLCDGYAKKEICEAPKTYTPIMEGETEVACKVKKIVVNID